MTIIIILTILTLYLLFQVVMYLSLPKMDIYIEEESYQKIDKKYIDYFVSCLKYSIENEEPILKEHFKDDRKRYRFHKRYNYWGKVTQIRIEVEEYNGKQNLVVWIDTVKLSDYAGYSMVLLKDEFDIAFWIHSSQKSFLNIWSKNTYHSDDYDEDMLKELYKSR